MYVIETTSLTYEFTDYERILKERVLNDVNLQVPVGAIYGFLGPNGAGKTTTIRLLLGLLKMKGGSIRIFDMPLESDRIGILKKTGSLIEAPSFYSDLTAAENLRVIQKLYDCPVSRIGETLEIVGLSDSANKIAGKFSLGMKQRLGIAFALLHSPSLLILDEPTNGLDPSGIIEIRELLRKLNTENKVTILVSSHLLSEVEKLVTHVGIISKGTMRFQGSFDELKARQSKNIVTSFHTSDPDRAMQMIIGNNLFATPENGHINVATADKQIISGITRQLVGSGIDIYQINTVKVDLESIFIDIVNN